MRADHLIRRVSSLATKHIESISWIALRELALGTTSSTCARTINVWHHGLGDTVIAYPGAPAMSVTGRHPPPAHNTCRKLGRFREVTNHSHHRHNKYSMCEALCAPCYKHGGVIEPKEQIYDGVPQKLRWHGRMNEQGFRARCAGDYCSQ